MYKISLSITNPLSGDSVTETYQVDQDTFDESHWTDGFPIASALIQRVKDLSSAREPTNWLDAATAISSAAKPG
jgi:hypothetical protein